MISYAMLVNMQICLLNYIMGS